VTEGLGGGAAGLVIVPQGTRAGEKFRMSRFSAALPPGAAGNWCRVTVRMERAGGWWAKIEATDDVRGQVVREAFLGPARTRAGAAERSILVHLPQASGRLSLCVFSEGPAAPGLAVRVLARRRVALALLRQGWRRLPKALRGDRHGLVGRMRAILGLAPARGGEAPPYGVWIDLFDRWGEAECAALAEAGADAGAIEVAVVDCATRPALEASLRSVPAQCRVRVISVAADWASLSGEWILVLAAGEVLASHAVACFALAARCMPGARGISADVDHLGASGGRTLPHFRPPPDPWLLAGDFLASGAWLFHRLAHERVWDCLPADADQARLALARAGPAETLQRLPLILAHVPEKPPRALPRAAPAPDFRGDAPLVSMIIPSACRSPHVLRCLRRLLDNTTYPHFEILLAVSSVNPADRRQARILRAVRTLPGVRLIDCAMPVFNFAAVNNAASVSAAGELLLLLNDDVVPLAPDWLARMVAYVCGQNGVNADIVGARLLYGNGMVQHGGVIMGLANLCEHAFRLADRADHGPQGLALLDRQVSAVTAACMMMRRRLFESLGGMDEEYAIALNDVDICLRAGQAGARVVMAAGVELYHYESVSLGRHYQGTRAHLEAIEVRRLKNRWAAAIAADPFYHPCASLELGREFQPGFPPRQTPLSWIRQETLAPH